ncbi:MAG: metal-sulfur cluster assembly factor, partial [Nitriliruptorales bacterium]
VGLADDGQARVEIVLTSGWCPFQVDLLAQIEDAVAGVDEVAAAEVTITLDEAWSAARLSDDARRKLRFLPEPADVADRDGYVAARSLPLRS